MKHKKELLEIFNSAKIDNKYYDFDDFKSGCKSLLKDMQKREVYCSLTVSKSGMTRRFGFKPEYNAVLNIVYNNKLSNEPVKVGGCGMDMGFHLLYTFYNQVLTKEEINNGGWNGLASDYIVI